MSRGWRVLSLHHVAVAHGADPSCEAFFSDLLGGATHMEETAGFVERMYGAEPAFTQTLEATAAGVVQRFVDTRGPGLHHIAYQVDSIDAALDDLRERGVSLIDETARTGGMGTRIAFLHPRAAAGVLVELVEEGEGVDG
jgi:methylmalonyl-CoA/ethylmalonyl-CoA epimerase